MRLDHIPLQEIVRFDRNPKAHRLDRLAASFARFGFVMPLLMGEGTGRLVAGHGRLEALETRRDAGEDPPSNIEADHKGDWLIPVIRGISFENESEALAYVVADNRLNEIGGWDEADLREVMATFEDDDDAEALGWSGDELDELLGKGRRSVSSKKSRGDELPPNVPERPATRPGDVWILGGHRVLCGDCRSRTDVEALFGDEKVPLVLADPPYCSGGFQEAGKSAGSWGDIAADNLSTRGYQSLITDMLVAARSQASYLFTDWRMWIPLYDVFEASGLAVRSMIVWDKGWPAMGSVWRAQHEIVMYGARTGHKRQKGVPGHGNVIQAKRTGNTNHYTEKPVDLLAHILEVDEATPRKACHVYDPFLGSGSTILAADERGRRCFGMEVEPRYVDVAVVRWQKETEETAVLEATGQTFEQVHEERVE